MFSPTPSPSRTRQISLYVTDEQFEQINAISRHFGISRSLACQQALTAALAQLEGNGAAPVARPAAAKATRTRIKARPQG